MEISQTTYITALIIILVAIVSAGAMYLYLLRTAVGKSMLAEVEKEYGSRKMREFIGKPHPNIPKAIVNISPGFSKIYEQAEYANQDGYSEICGIGYGKALEFLIKDYAIANSPENAEKIKKSKLVDCISKYVSDDSIRNCTDLARWLRNDETHYQRSFASHGLTELKKLIEITMLLIQQAETKRAVDMDIQALREGMVTDRDAQKK